MMESEQEKRMVEGESRWGLGKMRQWNKGEERKEKKGWSFGRIGVKGFMVATLLVMLACSYGHAARSQDLQISGEATVRQRNIVRLVGIRTVELNNGATEDYSPKLADDATGMYIGLPDANSNIVYEITVANDSGQYQVLSQITEQVETGGVRYEILGDDAYIGVAPGVTRTFQMRVSNVSGASVQVSLLLDYKFTVDDVTAPTIASSTSAWTYNTVTVNLRSAGTATSGVDHYEYEIKTKDGTTEVTDTGTTAGSLSVAKNGTSTVKYRTVSKYGTKSAWSAGATVKYDDVTPTVKMLANNVYTNNNKDDFATATYGPSGGAVTCKDNYNNTATKMSTLNVLGAVTVYCTAKSNAGKTSEKVTGSYTRNLSYTGTSTDIRCIDNTYSKECPRSNGVMTLPYAYTQFGPYIKANVGCYHVEYGGTNFNAANMRISAYWSNIAGYTTRSLSVSSTRVSYYIYVPSVADQLEITILNTGNANVTINSVKMTKVNSCPAS